MDISRRSVLGGVVLSGGAIAAGVFAGGRSRGEDSVPSVLVAGSLQGVASQVGTATVEAHGSVAARRLVTEGARNPDAMALADPLLFDGLRETVTLFATNALVIAYDPTSAFAAALTDDWRAAVSDPAISIGRTDPQRDPLGYRTVMALRLAAPTIDPDAVLERSTVVPETALMRTLEAGGIDAAFTYRNMAVEHDVPFVSLPTAVDFSDPTKTDAYAAATVDVGDRTIRGSPIAYAAAPFTEIGAAWVSALARSGDRLREAGFSVPADFPRTTAPDDPW